MRLLYISLAAGSTAFAAPTPQAPGGFDLGALLGGIDLGALLSGAGALLGGAPLGGAPAAAPAAAPAGGLNLGALLGGIDIGGIIGGLLPSGPTANAAIVISAYDKTRVAANTMNESGQKLANATDVAAAIKSWVTAAEGVTMALTEGAKNINADKGTIDLLEAANFQGPGDAVGLSLQTALDTIVANKAVIVKANASKQIVDALTSQKAASIGLNDAIHKKMPMLAQSIADAAGQKAVDGIEAVIKAFS